MSKETVIDLRSDTVTLPNREMRQAMLSAELGDDVIDVDPTVERLQRVIAERLGHEAAIFMPSGTMTNQVGLRLHCRPGDEFLCEERCHIFNFEQGAFAQLSGLVARTIPTETALLQLSDVQSSGTGHPSRPSRRFPGPASSAWKIRTTLVEDEFIR